MYQTGRSGGRCSQICKQGLRRTGNVQRHLWTISEIGEQGGKRIVSAMLNAGLIGENFEAYKEISDRKYRQIKFLKMRDLADEE